MRLEMSSVVALSGSPSRTPASSAGRRIPPAVTIDHVLADARIGVRAVSVHTIPGTDHRAVFAELVLPRR